LFELIDDDVVGVCTKSPVAVKIDFQPPELASLGLVYSKFPKEKKIARWILKIRTLSDPYLKTLKM
jgi:hypothetical protein